jgi:hypothetical protein
MEFQDERGEPRHPVACLRCGVRVLVRKNSLAHTVLQWTSATDTCTELSAGHRPAALIPTCAYLADSVDAAVRARQLDVADFADPPRN